ncbi:DNA polymerase III subunit delta' [Bowmanella dokdonensis]|uniref:DNA-directed DNA polymerase n=1 Tax=Bowmanella dokdonensis TaxID=751969 RepID=A0A939DKM9_9ALTE|nr:DNA polymerase III subunit delta' [Bowmanella dokdonensis]
MHHGLLLIGPQGLGKAELTREIGAHLLCRQANEKICGQCQACQLFRAGSHPDFYQVQSDKQIGVDEIRDAIEKLSSKAQLSGAKVLIIHQADSMTESAANALLKTLEEPTDQTYILLTTARPQRLLPTILSRCEKLTLPRPSQEQTRQWLSAEHAGPIEPELLSLYAASPLRLSMLLREEPELSYARFNQQLEQLTLGQLDALQMATQWQEQPARLIAWLQHWLVASIQQGRYNVDQLWALSHEALGAGRYVSNPGLNKILLLAQLLGPIQQLEEAQE